MSSPDKLLNLMDAYHGAHPTAQPLRNVWELFSGEEMLHILEEASGREIVFQVQVDPARTAPVGATYSFKE